MVSCGEVFKEVNPLATSHPRETHIHKDLLKPSAIYPVSYVNQIKHNTHHY